MSQDKQLKTSLQTENTAKVPLSEIDKFKSVLKTRAYHKIKPVLENNQKLFDAIRELDLEASSDLLEKVIKSARLSKRKQDTLLLKQYLEYFAQPEVVQNVLNRIEEKKGEPLFQALKFALTPLQAYIASLMPKNTDLPLSNEREIDKFTKALKCKAVSEIKSIWENNQKLQNEIRALDLRASIELFKAMLVMLKLAYSKQGAARISATRVAFLQEYMEWLNWPDVIRYCLYDMATNDGGYDVVKLRRDLLQAYLNGLKPGQGAGIGQPKINSVGNNEKNDLPLSNENEIDKLKSSLMGESQEDLEAIGKNNQKLYNLQTSLGEINNFMKVLRTRNLSKISEAWTDNGQLHAEIRSLNLHQSNNLLKTIIKGVARGKAVNLEKAHSMLFLRKYLVWLNEPQVIQYCLRDIALFKKGEKVLQFGVAPLEAYINALKPGQGAGREQPQNNFSGPLKRQGDSLASPPSKKLKPNESQNGEQENIAQEPTQALPNEVIPVVQSTETNEINHPHPWSPFDFFSSSVQLGDEDNAFLAEAPTQALQAEPILTQDNTASPARPWSPSSFFSSYLQPEEEDDFLMQDSSNASPFL